MDEQLKEQLRELGLLPLDLDPERQAYWTEHGIDWRKVETHYSPGTPTEHAKQERARREQIEQDVRTLYQLEEEGQGESEKYQRLETQIQEQLQEVGKSGSCLIGIGSVARDYPLQTGTTGTGGVDRDINALL